MTLKRCAVGLCLLVCLLPVIAISASSPATNIGDAFVDASAPSANFGSGRNLKVGNGATSVVQFDVNELLPAGTRSADIEKALLRLWVNKIVKSGSIDIFSGASAWSEQTVTYTTTPQLGTLVAADVPVTEAGVFVTVDATSLVKEWVDAPAQNHGFILAPSAGEPTTTVWFDSKENTTTSHLPELIVTRVGGGPVGPPGPIGPRGPRGFQGERGEPADLTSLIGSFIANGTIQQANSNFNISGSGLVGHRFGVGTQAPAAKLHVIGAAGERGAHAADALRVVGGTGGEGVGVGAPSSITAAGRGGNVVLSAGGGGMGIFTKGGEGGSITLQPGPGGTSFNASPGTPGSLLLAPGAGNVGIGTSHPAAKLHITHGTSNAWHVQIGNSGQASYRAGMRLSNAGFFEITNNALGTSPNFARLDTTGQWTAVSDRRLKTDIAALDGLLSKALALRPVSYRFIGLDSSPQLGFIAQEVERVLPEFVADADGLKTLNYSGLSVVAIGALQEQQRQIEQLQRLVDGLRALVCRERPTEEVCKVR